MRHNRMTVADLRAAKGQRVLSMLYVETLDEAAAAAAAGVDVLSIIAPLWTPAMRAAAGNPRVRCKVSGLVSEAGPGWTIDHLRKYFDYLVDIFGPQRLMWGSDWPMLDLVATYKSWYAATVALTAGWSPADRAALMGGTARRFYGL